MHWQTPEILIKPIEMSLGKMVDCITIIGDSGNCFAQLLTRDESWFIDKTAPQIGDALTVKGHF